MLFLVTRKSWFNFGGSPTPTILLHNFTRHSRNNWCFQTSIIDGFFEFIILQVNEVDLLQFSCVFKMKLFIRPLLLLLQLGMLSHCLQSSGQKRSGLDVSCFLSNLHPDHTTYILLEGFSSNRVKREKFVHGLDRSLDPSISQWSSMRFSCFTSKFVWAVLDVSINFSGTGNGSSLGE